MIEVSEADRERAEALWLLMQRQGPIVGAEGGRAIGRGFLEAFAAHRQQAEDAIIRAADKWLAAQYGLSPLVADIDRIRGIDAGGEGD